MGREELDSWIHQEGCEQWDGAWSDPQLGKGGPVDPVHFPLSFFQM